jgi:signal transduction histidine kinase
VTWQIRVHAAVLFASAAVAVWGFIVVRSRRTAPGRNALAWLMLAAAHWSVTSGLHALVEPVDTRVALSQIQYVGIVAVPPLWLLFASQYARLSWTSDRTLCLFLWLLPAVTVLLAFTNPAHGLLWRAVLPASAAGGARLMYLHGPWFWVIVAYSYAALAAGTLVLVRAIRLAPLAQRRQVALVVAGVVLPWLSNVLYIAGVLPAGLDPTPAAFALSGAFILWGLYQHRLLTLVPVARDLVIENMDVGVIVLDPARLIVDLNPAARALTGCSEASVGLAIDRAVSWWSQRATTAAASPGVPVVIDNDGRSLEVQMSPVRHAADKLAGWLVLVRDITAHVRAEAERQGLERRMMEQQRVESLSVLAGGIAHDFNNLLTGVLGNADLVALASPAGSETRANAEAIILGAERAADLVEKMIAYAGEGRIRPQPVDLDAVVVEMGALLQASAARHCTIRSENNGPLPHVTCDPTQLRQILLNLITNAAEAASSGSIITVSTGREILSEADLSRATHAAAASPGPHVFLEVSDQGTGIRPERMRQVFDPFFSTKAGGRGLGLAAVQGIVRSHHGVLRLVSTPGSGTSVKVWLPIAETREITEPRERQIDTDRQRDTERHSGMETLNAAGTTASRNRLTREPPR